MKLKHWLLIFLGITVFVLAFFLVVPVLIAKKSWWWFWGTLIFEAVCWIIAGIILLIVHLKSKKPEVEPLELDEAVQIAMNHSTHHTGNPDNFVYKNHQITKVGEPGAEKTAVLILNGYGTELEEERYFIMNKSKKQEFDMLINPTQKELENAIIKIADSQPTPVITEQVPGVDSFGRPTTKYVTTSTSRAEIKKQEEEKKAEEKSAF